MATPDPSEVLVVGAAAHPLRDAYHWLLEARWPVVLGSIALAFLAINALFALAYVAVGGIEGAREGSFADAFFFSVQTMGTIGYGAMHPTRTATHLLVVAESVSGLIVTAVATGIVFARFSRTTGEILFTKNACISPLDGVPTLTVRIGNERSNTIFEARVTITLIRTEKTQEGVVLYRMHDLALVRDRSQALQRSFTVMHPIDESSPLFGETPEGCTKREVEIAVDVAGTDETSLQPVHARRTYMTSEILWGARFVDVLSELPDGRLQLDVRRFHDTIATEPTAGFPYPRARGSASSS